MTNIDRLHNVAFARVSAFVILKDGEKVATVAIKYPRGRRAGRLYAYVHWLGIRMVMGYAGGDGCDKTTTACVSAGQIFDIDAADEKARELGIEMQDRRPWHIHYRPFVAALRLNDGYDWQHNLEKAGFKVLQAV